MCIVLRNIRFSGEMMDQNGIPQIQQTTDEVTIKYFLYFILILTNFFSVNFKLKVNLIDNFPLFFLTQLPKTYITRYINY